MLRRGVTALAAALLLTLVAPACAQSEEVQGGRQVADYERAFLVNVGRAGLAESSYAQLAVQRAASRDVRRYAQTLLRDHARANEALQAIASQHTVLLPRELSQWHRSILTRLNGLSGRAFDRLFLSETIRAHEVEIGRLENARRRVRDPALAEWIAETLPRLQEHLRLGRQAAEISRAFR